MKQLIIYIILILSANIYAQNNKVVVKIGNNEKKNSSQTLSEIKELIINESYSIEPFLKQKHWDSKSIQYNINNIYIIKLKNGSNTSKIISQIQQLEDIEYSEPYPISYIFGEPDDPFIANQYYLDITKAFDGHSITKGDTNVVIGIVDTGVDLLHEDLKDNYKYNYNDPINNIDDDGDGYVDNFYGWDVANGDNNPQSEENWHGTNVSGIAAAITNNATGIASMGYNSKIMPIKAMDGSGLITAGYEGIMYAASHGCQIINLSWGNNTYSQFAQDVINYATEAYGCLIVAAAGNRGAATDKRPDTWFYPASYNNVFSVAATGPTDNRWSGSSYAITVDVSAPGQSMYTTDQFNKYRYTNGTSSAAPMVSGLAALLKAHRPDFTHEQLAQQVRITSDYIDSLPENVYYSKQMGYGRINAFRALSVDNLPSVRIDSLNIDCNNLYDCDTLSVSFIATNYLAQATNTTIRLTSNSEFILPITNTISTGKFSTFEQISNTTSPFLFEVLDDLPYNESIWFEFEMVDEGYSDYQIFETIFKKDYINVAKYDIKTTLTSNGKIGYANWDKELGIGIRYKGEDIVSNAGIIIGSSSNNMASALYDVEEFSTISIVDTISNVEGLKGFEKIETIPGSNLTIAINHKVLLPEDDEIDNTIIHTYTINNNSGSVVENLKLSQFIDWDISHPNYNTIDYVDELNMAYTYSRTTNVIYAGLCLLNDMKAIPYAFDLKAGGNGGIDITQGFSNDLKWFTMNNNRDSSGNSSSSFDVASMLTSDFININASDSVELAFAHIIGTNLMELKTKASLLRENYNRKLAINQSKKTFAIYPNPAQSRINVKLLDLNGGSLHMYNSNGKLVYNNDDLTSIGSLEIDVSHLANGIYILKFTNKESNISKKLIIND